MPVRISCFFFSVTLLLTVGLSNPCLAQSKKIDSLQQLSNELTGKQQVAVLNQLCFELFSYDYRKVEEVADRAYRLSEKIGDEYGKAEALIYHAAAEFNMYKDSAAAKKLNESIALSRKINQDALEGYGLAYLGYYYQRLDQLDSAILYYNQAKDILKDGIQERYLSFLYLHLAEYYQLTNDQKLELEYLQKSLELTKKQTSRGYFVWTSERLASYYTNVGDYEKALSFLKDVQKQLDKDTIDNEEIATIQKQRGIIYLNQGKYGAALELFNNAKKFYERNSLPLELAELQSEVGYVFMEISNYEVALKNYFDALSMAEKNQFEFLRTRLMFRIAWVYYLLNQDSMSKEYIQKCLESAQANHHKFDEASALNLLGLIADRQDKNDEALDFFNQALAIRKSIGSRNGIASTTLNIGILFEKERKYSEALKYDLQSLAIEEATGHGIGMAYSYQSLGQLYIKLKNFEQADYFLAKAEKLSRKLNAGNVLIDIFKNRKDLLVAKGQYKEAIQYSFLYDNLKDSIFSQNLSNRITTLQNVFQIEQKNNEIEILNQRQLVQQKELENQQATIRQQRIILLASILILLLVSGVAVVIYRFYIRVKLLNREISDKSEEIQAQAEELTEANVALSTLNQEIFEQKEEILAQSEELTESNQTIASLNQGLEERIEQRTAELKQAYKELDIFFYRSSHDFRRPLTTFMGLAEVAKITLKEPAALELFEKVNETAHNLDKMLSKLQSISDVGAQELIYKEVFMKDVFELELSGFEEELNKHQIQTSISVKSERPFYSYYGLIRIIVQNLVENAIKFCNPQRPTIQLCSYEKDGEIVMEVKDNGRGIEPQYQERVFEMYFRGNEGSKGNGLGLYIVKKTVQKLNGRVEMESIFEEGTTVRVILPNKQI